MAGRGREKVNGTGRKAFTSVQARELANASKELQENLRSFQTYRLKIHNIGVRKVVTYVHQRQRSQFLREKGICRGPLAECVLPFLVGEVNKERAAKPPSKPIHPLGVAGDSVACGWRSAVWQGMDAVRGPPLQRLSHWVDRLVEESVA